MISGKMHFGGGKLYGMGEMIDSEIRDAQKQGVGAIHEWPAGCSRTAPTYRYYLATNPSRWASVRAGAV